MALTGMLVGFDFAQPTLRYIKVLLIQKCLLSVPLKLTWITDVRPFFKH